MKSARYGTSIIEERAFFFSSSQKSSSWVNHSGDPQPQNPAGKKKKMTGSRCTPVIIRLSLGKLLVNLSVVKRTNNTLKMASSAGPWVFLPHWYLNTSLPNCFVAACCAKSVFCSVFMADRCYFPVVEKKKKSGFFFGLQPKGCCVCVFSGMLYGSYTRVRVDRALNSFVSGSGRCCLPGNLCRAAITVIVFSLVFSRVLSPFF